ncbi:hypothetical protein ABPG75_002344 [Micractinium tetrahymenae]
MNNALCNPLHTTNKAEVLSSRKAACATACGADVESMQGEVPPAAARSGALFLERRLLTSSVCTTMASLTVSAPAALLQAPAAAPRRAPAPQRASLHATWRPTRRLLRVQASAASSSSPAAAASPAVAAAVGTLYKAAADSSVAPTAVFAALQTLEQAKLQPSAEWGPIIGGAATPGNRWRLVFTSGTKQVEDALKGVGKGGGSYFPLTACQRWDATKSEIENGIFLGRLAALTFKGPYRLEGKVLAFDFDTLTLRLGGWTAALPLKAKLDPSTFRREKSSPFFVFFYVDERVICARGRGGGFAVWARTTPQWELQSGVV